MQSTWHKAAIDGDVSLIERLIREGAEIDSRDRYGQTAIMLAAVHGYDDLANMLIAHHADLDVTAKYGLSALMLAAVNGHVDIANALVESGANVDLQGCGAPGFAGKTAYDLAMVRGFAELAKTILGRQR